MNEAGPTCRVRNSPGSAREPMWPAQIHPAEKMWASSQSSTAALRNAAGGKHRGPLQRLKRRREVRGGERILQGVSASIAHG